MMSTSHHHSVTTLTILLLTFVILPFGKANKQVVLFAGPHQTGASSVEQFYHNFASGYNNAKTSKALAGWAWPRVQGDLGMKNANFERPKVFQYLVTHADNDKQQDLLMTAIREAYGRAGEGIILGTEEFDRIGETPSSRRNGLDAMERVVNFLRAEQEDVWVILNYRTPRVEQWISYWKHMDKEPDYKEFLCDDYDQVWEMLDTGMNPLGLAQTIRHETGWNVVLIDMVGAQDLGTDSSHIIACEILGGTDCNGGFVADRFNKTYHNNAVDKEFDGLDESQLDQLETLLRKRDCAYEEKLRNDHGFYILHESTLWQGCNMKDPNGIYSKLKDTDILLDLFQTQKGCEDLKGNKLEDFLLPSDNYDALTAKKTLGQLQKEMAVNQFENLEAFELDEDAKAKQNKARTPTAEKIKGKDEDLNDGHSVLGYFFLVVMVGGGAVYKLYTARSKANDGSNRLWYRENKQQNSYLARDYLDAEYGDVDDDKGKKGHRSAKSTRNRYYQDSSDEDSNVSGGLEMASTFSDWADERDEDYYDPTTEVAQDRQTRNRVLMQMPKTALTAPRHHRTAATTYSRKRSTSRERDLDWAMADQEIESSEEENDSDSDSDSGRKVDENRGSDSDFDDEY
ncbi:unnamed protein product [Cylindrotheca closterium]|uniref:Uncharacterized protein n=1 Tax=Cylindrotheca closterium TaxID=2856 RepID=A0AAD2G6H6_9STRA|nr:unnamed protein product [Cylindrotheca closterium]